MKKHVTGIVAGATLVVAALAGAPATVAAQSGEPFVLSGLGSSIGVTVREVGTEDASNAKLAQPAGALVESVREGSPAARAGLRMGDIVVEFDGERIRSVRQFTRLVQESAPRRGVALVVVRGTERHTLQVTPEASNTFPDVLSQVGPRLRVLPRDGDARPRDLLRDFNFNITPDVLRRRFALDGPSLGVSVTPVSGQLADYFGVTQGVLVASVEANTPAAEAGIKAGDVITAVGGRAITSAADITEAMRARNGEAVDVTVTRDRKSLVLKATPAQPASGRRGLPV